MYEMKKQMTDMVNLIRSSFATTNHIKEVKAEKAYQRVLRKGIFDKLKKIKVPS